MKKLFTDQQREVLIHNGAIENFGQDHVPVVKLFTHNAACLWLLTELDEQDDTIAFGLCDLGMGCPELGSVSLTEITELEKQMGVLVECDQDFQGIYPISVYAEAASNHQEITFNETALAQAAAQLKRDRAEPV